jgi:hypothetical protein
MASAQVKGIYIIKVRSPKGSEVEVMRTRSEYIGNGGSSDAVIANSPEKWAIAPLVRAPSASGFFQGGDQVILSIIPDSSATLDISDAQWIIPVTLDNGQVISLANNTTDMNSYLIGDSAVVAAQESVIAKHTAPTGRRFMFGGDKIFMSVENNA